MPEQSQYKEVLERARNRFARAVEAEREMRTEAMLDLDFLGGEQWDERIKTERTKGPSPRPCLVFNKCLPPVTQLGNQARQNKPAIQVNAVDSAGDPDTAKVMAGMIKHIEYDSDADQAYDTALFYAAGCGFGFWRYGCEYTSPDSFDQDLKTIPVTDPFSIYLDIDAKKLDRSDMKWAFVLDRMPNDVHEERFGKDAEDLSAEFTSELETQGWRDEDSKQVAEYWEVDTVTKTLRIRRDPDGTLHPVYLEDATTLDDGEPDENGIGPRPRPMTDEEIDATDWVMEDELPGSFNKYFPDRQGPHPRERKVDLPRVMQYIINGAKVLEEPVEWDGDTIPIVIVTGLEMIIRGKKKSFSMTRFARDPQQLLNFYKTMEAETISLAPKPKFVGAVGQFKSKRRDWQRANTDNAAYLEYDPVAVGDKMAPAPEWHTFDPPVQALAIGAAAAIDDIKASTGYFDANLGINKRDESGVAREADRRQGDVSNFHFLDNLGRGIKRGGRILLDLIPKKYDTARQVRIIGDDQKQRIIAVNQPGLDENGKPYHHRLDVGKYDATVQQGTSYDTQRKETSSLIMALAKGNPEVWQLAADVFFENQDFVGADRLAKRFKKALPPGMADEDDNPEIPPQVQAQMQQLAQSNQQLLEQNKQLFDMAKGKMAELQVRAESAERIARLKAESDERKTTQTNMAKIEAAAMLSKSDSMNQLAALDHAAVEHTLQMRADLLHDQLTVEQDAAGAERDRQHESEGQQSDQAHEQGMSAQEQQHAQQMQEAGHEQAQELQGGAQDHAQQLQTQAQKAAASQQTAQLKSVASLQANKPKPKPKAA